MPLRSSTRPSAVTAQALEQALAAALDGHRTTPLEAGGRGLAAGAVGTGVMTGYQTAVMKARGSEGSSTPGEVLKRVIEGVFQRPVSDQRMGLLTNVGHWLYGTSWGALYGLVHESAGRGSFRHGLAFGAGVWAVSLVQLPLMQLSPPVWKHPPAEVALDLSYHLAYGLGVAGGYRALDR